MTVNASAAGTLGATVTEMFRLSRQMREEGRSEADIAQYIEGVLRTSWPQVRRWHHVCDQCCDTGWVEGSCTPDTPCGRPFRLPGPASMTRPVKDTARSAMSSYGPVSAHGAPRTSARTEERQGPTSSTPAGGAH